MFLFECDSVTMSDNEEVSMVLFATFHLGCYRFEHAIVARLQGHL